MEKLSEIYLDWVNNYLTISKFAEGYGINERDALELIAIC